MAKNSEKNVCSIAGTMQGLHFETVANNLAVAKKFDAEKITSPRSENVGTNMWYHFKMYAVMLVQMQGLYFETVANNLVIAKKISMLKNVQVPEIIRVFFRC